MLLAGPVRDIATFHFAFSPFAAPVPTLPHTHVGTLRNLKKQKVAAQQGYSTIHIRCNYFLHYFLPYRTNFCGDT